MSDSQQPLAISCPAPSRTGNVIRLGHGSGGKLSSRLIEDLFLPLLGNEILSQLDDAALLDLGSGQIAITTDSYVVTPIFFPGGDIGSLSVHGTLNDLAMRGARPLFMTASFILEEGLSFDDLSRVAVSVNNACLENRITLVAADTKVVNKGAADKLFITTCGVGTVDQQPAPGASRARPGDCVLLSGDVGRHGIAIMACREELDLETSVSSDSAALHNVVQKMLSVPDSVHCLRDITRGGLASVLNELAAASEIGVVVDEENIPIHPEVRAVCELLGLDPFYVACEGRLVALVAPERVDELLAVMAEDPAARASCVIGRATTEHPGRVVMRSRVGGHRILDKLSGDQLPRIC